MSGAERCFLDSNILLYAVDLADAAKQQRARQLQEQLLARHLAVVSYQVIQEYLNTCLRKFSRQVAPDDALRYAEDVLWPICAVLPSPALARHAVQLHEQGSFSFYDSLIVAAAIESRCGILYSEDLQDGRSVEGLRILNPFAGPATAPVKAKTPGRRRRS